MLKSLGSCLALGGFPEQREGCGPGRVVLQQHWELHGPLPFCEYRLQRLGLPTLSVLVPLCLLVSPAEVMERALFHMENSYSVANVRGRGFLCRTNMASNTAFRGFGGPQGMLVSENWVTDVAQTLGMPAEEVRRLNLYVEGDLTPYNQVLERFTLDRCWDECLARSGYKECRAAVELYNK